MLQLRPRLRPLGAARRSRCHCKHRVLSYGVNNDEPRPPREMSDERISQLRRFLVERRGQPVAAPETEVPHAVPVGSTGMVLAIAEGSSGGFGARMWPSAKTIVDHIALQAWPHDLRGKSVLELGCGVGMAGLAAGAVGARVLLTDRDAAVLERAEANLQLNASLVRPSLPLTPSVGPQLPLPWRYLFAAPRRVDSGAALVPWLTARCGVGGDRRSSARVGRPRWRRSSGEQRRRCSVCWRSTGRSTSS
jgi:hypothetical protein